MWTNRSNLNEDFMKTKSTKGIAGNNGNGYKQMFWHTFSPAVTTKKMSGDFMSKGKSSKSGKRGIAGSGCSCNH